MGWFRVGCGRKNQRFKLTHGLRDSRVIIAFTWSSSSTRPVSGFQRNFSKLRARPESRNTAILAVRRAGILPADAGGSRLEARWPHRQDACVPLARTFRTRSKTQRDVREMADGAGPPRDVELVLHFKIQDGEVTASWHLAAIRPFAPL